MDDFKRKKKFGSKGKNIKKKLLQMSKFLMDNLAKISQYIFSYSCVSEHSISLFLFFFFKLAFLSSGRWGRPPPLPSAKNASFFYVLPNFSTKEKKLHILLMEVTGLYDSEPSSVVLTLFLNYIQS